MKKDKAQEPKKVVVYKLTLEDWHRSFSLGNNELLVRVAFVQLLNPLSRKWRVLVWGNDDDGMERDFVEAHDAWSCFLSVISLEHVSRTLLTQLEFVRG